MIEISNRGKGKYKKSYGMKDFYNTYKEKTKDLNPKYRINYKLYAKIVKRHNRIISDMIIYNSFEYLIPRRLGILRIKKIKQRFIIKDGKFDTSYIPIDWASTRKMWRENPELAHKKYMYYLNNHSEGYRYRWYYNKYRCNIPNNSAYCFLPCRRNAREIAIAIKNTNIDYYE